MVGVVNPDDVTDEMIELYFYPPVLDEMDSSLIKTGGDCGTSGIQRTGRGEQSFKGRQPLSNTGFPEYEKLVSEQLGGDRGHDNPYWFI